MLGIDFRPWRDVFVILAIVCVFLGKLEAGLVFAIISGTYAALDQGSQPPRYP